MAVSDERQIRIEKLDKIKALNINPYIERCDRTHTLIEAIKLTDGESNIQLCGRLMLKRIFGKLIFATIQDFSGRFQIALSKEDIDNDNFKYFQKMIDVGDFIWVKGEIFTTHKGELTLRIKEFKLLSKTIRPLPEKFHGITDLESRSRQRYLDLLMDNSTLNRFKKRITIIKTIRKILDNNNFLEVETPVLQTKPSGAMAKPFKTHHNALDIDLFLRIAPETYLKRCIAGGFEKVYEFARCFRNEGMDPSHLQEFTLLEYYCAYWNYIDNMNFTEKLIKEILQTVNGSLKLTYQGQDIDFDGEWPRYSMRDLILKHSSIDIYENKTKDSLITAIKKNNITLDDVDFNKIGWGNLVDQLYKKVARPKMISPQFLIHHPIELSPLARKNDENPQITDRFQLVVNGWEIVNAYSELVDPIDQKERLIKQQQDRKKGDDEAMIMEDDFIVCMEYGMPPISGWGMGIDRFVALLTDQENLREVVLFPLMRPLDKQNVKNSGENIKQNNDTTSDDTLAIIPPQDIKELGPSTNTLQKLFEEKVTSASLKAHSIASAAVLRGIAKHFKLNEQNYYYLGLIHDIDFDLHKDMKEHGQIGAKWLEELGLNKDALHAIRAHNPISTGIDPSTFIDYSLLAGETITGLISATAKIYPDKKVASVKVKSIIKRMKAKAFAAKVNRDNIRLCEKIGLPLQEFVEIALNSMKEVAEELGL